MPPLHHTSNFTFIPTILSPHPKIPFQPSDKKEIQQAMSKYFEDPAWADITPLPLEDGGPNALAQIAYSAEYDELMQYLRAVMAANEYSPRVLALTEDLIELNPAHYTVWLYRFQCLVALQSDLQRELAWLNETALVHLKNYQIWHHRNLIVDRLGSSEGEARFVERMFERDAKNYHVWSYRQWLVTRFDLWEQGELEFTERMIESDVRNNSAWNHRWFIVNGREEQGVPGVSDPAIRAREIQFAQEAIGKAPHNESPWNYMRGIARKSGMALGHLREFVEQYASLAQPDKVRSSYALDFLVDILAEEKGGKEQAGEALDLLASKYDPIRKNYWEHKKDNLGLAAA
ncbi:Hypothetical protein R9X50_00662800 [Acrodontium crateriforme]|uniref:Protein farnesyltransferase/geranylgeranyltransferase type-1 subunit alpha n=1 Tax=Acrodontium crateriforme TaxID=150365 RepID=A0AAQ3M9H7_9PEZI|nr:Hypothetical protein R9X50_00662800 [Acrodontium crateriforme]